MSAAPELIDVAMKTRSPNQALKTLSQQLAEKQSLLITFENSFDQKIGPVYSPNEPMLEIETTGDRNIFVDLQKIYF